MNWSEFFAMGGYGVYVWSAYTFAAVVLIVNVVTPLVARKKALRRLAGLTAMRGRDEKAA